MATKEELLNNPDDLDMNDEEAILALVGGADEVDLKNFDLDDEQDAAVQADDKDKDGDLGGKDIAQKSDDKGDSETELPAPIQSKSGKHTIPYNVLEDTRKNLKLTATDLTTANAEIERLKTLVDSGGDGATDEELEKIETASKQASTPEEEFERKNGMSSEQFEREYGEGLTKSLMAQAEESLEMRGQLNILMGDRNEKVEEQEVQKSSSLQEAIDAIPALAKLQAEGGDKWLEAIEVDDALKQLPKYRNNPDDLDGRFAAVAKEMGLPVKALPKKQQVSNDDNDDTSVPTSISDFPGGSDPAQSDMESIENMDTADVGHMLNGMTLAQQEEYLNKL